MIWDRVRKTTSRGPWRSEESIETRPWDLGRSVGEPSDSSSWPS